MSLAIRASSEQKTAAARLQETGKNTLAQHVRRAVRRAGQLLVAAYNVILEVRAQKALIEAELYLNRYRHTSKNDDDLPILARDFEFVVRSDERKGVTASGHTPVKSEAQPVNLRLGERPYRRAQSRRHPRDRARIVLIVFALFACVIAARLTLGFQLYLHHFRVP